MPASCALASPSAICTAIARSRLTGKSAGKQELAQRLSFDPLHGDPGDRIRRPDVVDRDDVRVVERRGRSRLVLESLQARRIVRDLRIQHLQSEVAREAGVTCKIDLGPSLPNRGAREPRRGRAGRRVRASSSAQCFDTVAVDAPASSRRKTRATDPRRRASPSLRGTAFSTLRPPWYVPFLLPRSSSRAPDSSIRIRA